MTTNLDTEYFDAFNNAIGNQLQPQALGLQMAATPTTTSARITLSQQQLTSATRAAKAVATKAAKEQANESNTYETHQTAAKSLIDVALFATNVSYVVNLEWDEDNSTNARFIALNVFVYLSLLLQVVTFFVLLWLLFQKRTDKWETDADQTKEQANKTIDSVNAWVTGMVGLITMFQVVISLLAGSLGLSIETG